jgi:hypothetical protein
MFLARTARSCRLQCQRGHCSCPSRHVYEQTSPFRTFIVVARALASHSSRGWFPNRSVRAEVVMTPLLDRRLTVAAFLALTWWSALAASASAQPACPTGTQRLGESCIANQIVNFTTCLRQTTGGELVVQGSTRKAGDKGTTVNVEFGGTVRLVGANGAVRVDDRNRETIISESRNLQRRCRRCLRSAQQP